MNVEFQYKIGDRIWFKELFNNVRNEKCSFCGGTGEVIGIDATTEDCPRCEGRGYTHTRGNEWMRVEGPIMGMEIFFYDGEPMVRYFLAKWGLKTFEVWDKDVLGLTEQQIGGTEVIRENGEKFWWSDWKEHN